MSKQYASSLLPSVTNPLARSFAENYVAYRGISFASEASNSTAFNNVRTQFMGDPLSTRPVSNVGLSLPQSDSSPVRSNGALNGLRSSPVESASEAVEEVGSAGSVGEAVAPELALAQMAKDFGSGINNIWTNITNSAINSNYIHTMSTGHGIGLTQEATNVASSSYANSSNSSLGGSIGAALGGPVGMLIGRGIAGLFNTPVQHAVAYSATGEFNPQSGSTPQSQSSRQPAEPDVEMSDFTSQSQSSVQASMPDAESQV